mmetsp:Transcript_19300/g.60411  ORF Transcript_19300/g.60411 Transcript_19300/m.60411 type:complete len:232 (+) Transcript_19300:313-1008(+)
MPAARLVAVERRRVSVDDAAHAFEVQRVDVELLVEEASRRRRHAPPRDFLKDPKRLVADAVPFERAAVARLVEDRGRRLVAPAFGVDERRERDLLQQRRAPKVGSQLARGFGADVARPVVPRARVGPALEDALFASFANVSMNGGPRRLDARRREVRAPRRDVRLLRERGRGRRVLLRERGRGRRDERDRRRAGEAERRAPVLRAGGRGRCEERDRQRASAHRGDVSQCSE